LTFLLIARRPPSPTLFPYTTLFRSEAAGRSDGVCQRPARCIGGPWITVVGSEIFLCFRKGPRRKGPLGTGSGSETGGYEHGIVLLWGFGGCGWRPDHRGFPFGNLSARSPRGS